MRVLIPPVDAAAALAEARRWIGTPYLHQASARGAGADCLGFVRGVWRALYGEEPEAVPPYTPDWNERAFAATGEEPLLDAARRWFVEKPREAAAPGDVLVFRVLSDGPAKHCGILSSQDRFLHAYAGRAVVESPYGEWWRRRLVAAFGWPGSEIT
ncbi:MAG: C40 family peptidase [Parvularculaceae bacterium]|nr:C40 family peptidase [Parvularculaceae bacterium]